MEFVTNCPVLLILYVDIINNYNKTTVHNVVLFFWYYFNFGHYFTLTSFWGHFYGNTPLTNLVKYLFRFDPTFKTKDTVTSF